MIDPHLIDALNNKNVILFVGAGVSSNLGLPTWRDLVKQMAEELGYDPDIFLTHGDYMELAEYYCQVKGSIGGLRSWMDRSRDQSNIKITDSKIHEYIFKLNCPIIYTTNYDRWLERTYEHYEKPYHLIRNIKDLCNLKGNIPQIIKFHGDFEDDSSLVLTESSYFKRFDFEGPLDIKLRADSLGKTILFIGYSLSDLDIRYLFYKLHHLWDNFSGSIGRPRSYIFMNRPNPIKEKVLDTRGITMISSDEIHPSFALENFLQELVQLTSNS